MAETSITDAFALAREAYATPEVRFLSEKQHGVFILAILRSTFTRERPAILDNDFHEQIDNALGVLRDRGELGLPQSSGRSLCLSWMADGWLEKDLASDGRPVYRPSAAAQTVLDWLASRSSRRLVSAPRVNQVFDNVAKLAALADPDREALIRDHERRMQYHLTEAERLRAGGDLPVGTDDELIQYASLVADAMNEIPSDFRLVGEQFSAAKRKIHGDLLSGDGTPGQVMGSVSAAARHITTETPQGRAFVGVADLIRDEAQMGALRENVARIMSSPVADMFTESERVMFANLASVFVSNVGLVLEGPRALTRIVKGRLVAHVSSAGDQGGLSATIRAARAALRDHTGPLSEAGLVGLGQLRVNGSTLRLHDPRPVDAPRPLAETPAARSEPLSLEYLRRWGGPHGQQVADHVSALLSDGRERVTLAQAWEAAPAELRRSVELVAYLGHPTRDRARHTVTDIVTVTEGEGQRTFRIPRVEFTNDHAGGKQ